MTKPTEADNERAREITSHALDGRTGDAWREGCAVGMAAERARIVEALRAKPEIASHPNASRSDFLTDIAAAIENGDL